MVNFDLAPLKVTLLITQIKQSKSGIHKNHTLIIAGHYQKTDNIEEMFLNTSVHNVPKWLNTLQKSCNKCCKIFKVYLTILGSCTLKG